MNTGNASVEVYQKKVGTIRDLLERSKGQIAACLPKHLTPERMIRVALTSIQRTPELLECEPLSLVGSVMLASQLGLELDNVLGHAYLVPFNNNRTKRKEAQMIVGYKGFLALARRSGEISTFRAVIAYANEAFTWNEGTDCKINHVPKLSNRGEPVAVYATIRLKDGSHDFEVLPWERILECQKLYGRNKYGPWHAHLEEMAKKTAIRRLAKRVPVSVEMQRAAAVDELAEAEIPQMDLAELPVTRTDEVAALLAAQAQEQGAEDAAERAAIEGEGQQ